jgi:Fe2+ or Zn2+ uptake regulation protein
VLARCRAGLSNFSGAFASLSNTFTSSSRIFHCTDCGRLFEVHGSSVLDLKDWKSKVQYVRSAFIIAAKQTPSRLV